MTWSFVGGTMSIDTSGNPWTVYYPGDIDGNLDVDDLVVVVVATDNTARIASPPAGGGWSVVGARTFGSDTAMTMFAKVLDAPVANGSTFLITWDNVARGTAYAAAYRNPDFRVKVGANAVGGAAAGSSHVISPVTTPTPNSLIIAAIAIDMTAVTTPNFTWPAGWTERNDSLATVDAVAIGFADYDAPDIGSYGATVTVTPTNETSQWIIAALIENVPVDYNLAGTATGTSSAVLSALADVLDSDLDNVVDADSDQVQAVASSWDLLIETGGLEGVATASSSASGTLILNIDLSGFSGAASAASGRLKLDTDTETIVELRGTTQGTSSGLANLFRRQHLNGLGDGDSFAEGDLFAPIGNLLTSAVRQGIVATSFATIPRVWRSDMYQTKIEEISPAKAMKMTASYREDFETKRQATVDVRNPDALDDLHDFVILELAQWDNFGNETVFKLGHYVVMGRDVTMDNHGRSGTIQLRDLTWFLQQSNIAEQYKVLAGTDFGAAVRTIAIQQGIPANLINIPDAGIVTPVDIISLENDNWLKFMNDLLAGGMMIDLWIAQDLRLTSKKIFDPRTAVADATYRSADGAKIVPPLRNTPDISRIRNRIKVYKSPSGEEPGIKWVANVTDPGNPLHPQRLADRLGSNTPVILGESFEESTITTEADAKAMAEAKLSEAASYLDKINMQTYLDDTLDGHKVIELDIEEGDAHYYVGTWLQQGWEVTVDGPVATVSRELTRTIDWS
jgi:hypothetical protein